MRRKSIGQHPCFSLISPSLLPHLESLPPRVEHADETPHPNLRLHDLGGGDHHKGEIHGQLHGEECSHHRPPQLRGIRAQLHFRLPLGLWERQKKQEKSKREGRRKKGVNELVTEQCLRPEFPLPLPSFSFFFPFLPPSFSPVASPPPGLGGARLGPAWPDPACPPLSVGDDSPL